MKTDREKLIELTSKAEEQYYNETPVGKISFKTHRAYIADYLISKGVTIPVMCGECKHWYKFDFEETGGECEALGDCVAYFGCYVETEMTDFCNRGERKEE